MATVEASSIRNRLLMALPLEALAALLPRMQRVELPFRTVLHAPDQIIERALFPEGGWVSMLVTLEDGDAMEVGMVGAEGMVGLALVSGSDRSPMEALVQSPGTALALDTEAFHAAMIEVPGLRELLHRYAFAFNMQVTMTAACNGRHGLDERLARWLLMSHDRSEGDEFPMTHEFLSTMLGVRRSGVSLAAAALQRAGLIRYEQGCIRITDRAGLENAACECHRVVRREFVRLLGPGVLG